MVLRPEGPMASLGPTLISGKDQSHSSVCSTSPLSVSVQGASVGMKIHREDHGVLQGGDVEHGWGGEDQGRRGGLKVWGEDMEKGKAVQIKLQNLGWISWARGTQGAGVGVTGPAGRGQTSRAGLGMVAGPFPHCPLWNLVFSVHGALEVVDDALERQSPEALLEALQDPVLALRGVRRDFADWYLDQLSSDREQKAQVRLRLSPATSSV